DHDHRDQGDERPLAAAPARDEGRRLGRRLLPLWLLVLRALSLWLVLLLLLPPFGQRAGGIGAHDWPPGMVATVAASSRCVSTRITFPTLAVSLKRRWMAACQEPRRGGA